MHDTLNVCVIALPCSLHCAPVDTVRADLKAPNKW